MAYRVAVVGATGAVGEAMIAELERSTLPIAELVPMASARSAGKTVAFRGAEVPVVEATPEAFSGVDLALFSAGGQTSRALAPEAVRRGAVVVDNSSAFRLEDRVPLVVPEVNAEALADHRGLIANPNCSTIQMVVALAPLRERYGLRRIVVSTYQAVSGAGRRAVDALRFESGRWLEGEGFVPEVLPVASLPVKYPIADNVIPQIDRFEPNGFTFEEMKMVRETQKIFGDPALEVAATCVRVPVTVGHSEAVTVELEEAPASMEDVVEALRAAPGVVVWDDPTAQRYPTPMLVRGERDVYVGRIRRDLFRPNVVHLWVVADNLVKGAAWNAVQIAETLEEKGLLRVPAAEGDR
ncbi:aspartate-semialdehyde dehydrogenase [Hydrogenibacillus schlegelii]|uniref:Aspartate-semialdehyde dehydrogenase n=1 Tax=Hydrogenibacillus schlegelii TaxID=1484 RepID=A0A132NCS7_HYDSH|nr:aspartate-semialdehyde dehydrogenase [Hydrogenibacillus schlegelii]KWX07979.1 aspartate-semialdehyde dehydrogenase [Hydrogenibacillus schlegelii]MBT9282853.1 aspartate-semialdehyde dehydrogenase [Hydrogenibacillus schlegelii]OAR03674.1 aspartate-semialdehyde dehydrogenase [Hydrogenibacillus schlegelii]PTQ54128.1 MAG: Aspartate-semialdehyde dehydrogenase [Hydrogenibacillus schlegelii]